MRGTWPRLAGLFWLAGCIPGAGPPDRAAPPPRFAAPRSAPPRFAPSRSALRGQAADPPPDWDDEDDRPIRRDDRPPRPDDPDDDDVAALPAPRPAWEARPVAPDARVVEERDYRVRPGDTLSRIAERTGAPVEAIARANGLDPPYAVVAGRRLHVPGGRYHLVGPGQTGIAIARAYGVEWSRIVAANRLAEPYVLRVGQRIEIPGVGRGSTSAAERAAAFRLDVDDILTGGEPALAANQAPARPAAGPKRVLPATAAVAAPAALLSGFVWPVDGRVVKRFGRGASGDRSDGIKIAVPLATPVRATADGVVAYAGDGIAALGGLVIVRHGGGWTSVYGHASRLLVRRGQSVRRGQTVALSGDTGFADRPELHFELRRGRTPVDPVTRLPRL